MNLIQELIGEINAFHIIIFITILNISLTLTSIWIFLSDRTMRENVSRRLSDCEHAIMVIKDYAREIENDSSLNGVGIDGLQKSIKLMKKDLKKMEQSLARFAPPLDENTDYKTVTVVNAKLK